MSEWAQAVSWPDLVGMVGVVAVLYAYFRLQMGRWDPAKPSYALVNLLGAGAILFSLVFDFNLSAFAVELAWFLISLMGLVRYMLQHK